MSDIHGSAERSGRPSPAWLKKLATGLVEKVEARGMTLTIEGAEVVVAERVRAVAATMKITERSARAYFDHDGLAALADGLVETFADEEPGTDLLTLRARALSRFQVLDASSPPWPNATSSLKRTKQSMPI